MNNTSAPPVLSAREAHPLDLAHRQPPDVWPARDPKRAPDLGLLFTVDAQGIVCGSRTLVVALRSRLHDALEKLKSSLKSEK